MLVDQSDAATIDAAIDAGVSAYIVDGLRKNRVKAILDMTISRFNAFAKLKKELETAKSQLDDRKTIDRAKALAMRAKSIPEEQAYALMRHERKQEDRRGCPFHYHRRGAVAMTPDDIASYLLALKARHPS